MYFSCFICKSVCTYSLCVSLWSIAAVGFEIRTYASSIKRNVHICLPKLSTCMRSNADENSNQNYDSLSISAALLQTTKWPGISSHRKQISILITTSQTHIVPNHLLTWMLETRNQIELHLVVEWCHWLIIK